MNDRERLIEIVKSSLIKHIDKSCCLAENIVDDLLTEGVTTLPVAFSDNRRERMVELLGGYYEETGINIVHYFTDEESEMLADYILSDGWIRPPCMVGDTVFVLTSDSITGFEKSRVKRMLLKNLQDGLTIKIIVPCVCDDWGGAVREFYPEDFGKTVFLTPEAAEKALAERRRNNE